jgi:hypothetical protein
MNIIGRFRHGAVSQDPLVTVPGEYLLGPEIGAIGAGINKDGEISIAVDLRDPDGADIPVHTVAQVIGNGQDNGIGARIRICVHGGIFGFVHRAVAELPEE